MSKKKSLRENAIQSLLAERNADGHWRGELSSSALSTATAVIALSLAGRSDAVGTNDASAHRGTGFQPVSVGRMNSEKKASSESANDAERHSPQAGSLCHRGIQWLTANQNEDGGWGDTTRSFSNISTTLLCWSAFGAAEADEEFAATVKKAKSWIEGHVGSLDREAIARKVVARYGKDKTFSVPILMACCLGGRLGEDGWDLIPSLPFELAAFPRTWFAALRLPVVSYALPALIAIGQLLHHKKRRHPIHPASLARKLTRERTLRILLEIQPASGGFLEATPLTSFVTMALAGAGHHPSDDTSAGEVIQNAIAFLGASIRDDGSWPIDTDLATWATTLSVNALSETGHRLADRDARPILEWLLDQQYREVHPFTVAAPGAWAWTELPGGVPDADDTSGALLAIHHLRALDPSRVDAAAERGVQWLLDLQNRDGGIPTFCRGWGALPFDRSCNDITAHAVAAWAVWEPRLSGPMRARIQVTTEKALAHLAETQRADGSWLPLWFGNQHIHDDENPTYGTTRVVHGLAHLDASNYPEVADLIAAGRKWLVANQNDDGGWGGGKGHSPSIEETALAVTGLGGDAESTEAVAKGRKWLADATKNGKQFHESPIGFYFAKLWYYERLYPRIFTVAASGEK